MQGLYGSVFQHNLYGDVLSERNRGACFSSWPPVAMACCGNATASNITLDLLRSPPAAVTGLWCFTPYQRPSLSNPTSCWSLLAVSFPEETSRSHKMCVWTPGIQNPVLICVMALSFAYICQSLCIGQNCQNIKHATEREDGMQYTTEAQMGIGEGPPAHEYHLCSVRPILTGWKLKTAIG